jgi:hypothetical protein
VGDVDQAGDVGVDHGVPVLQRHLLRRLGRQRQAGVVDQHGDAAEGRRQLGDHLLHGSGVTHVEGGDVYRHLGAQFGLQLLQALETATGQHQRPAGLGKAAGGGAAEAGGGTGDENHIAHESIP